nr:unnamed protein product [Callosobruchus chinensis]
MFKLWPGYTVSLLIMVIGCQGARRLTLLSALCVMPVCRAAAHILAASIQKAGLRNMVEFNASKTQYCTLSNKRCPSEHWVLMNNQALPRSHSFKLLGVSITENMIRHEHVSSIATAAGKKLGYLF